MTNVVETAVIDHGRQRVDMSVQRYLQNRVNWGGPTSGVKRRGQEVQARNLERWWQQGS